MTRSVFVALATAALASAPDLFGAEGPESPAARIEAAPADDAPRQRGPRRMPDTLATPTPEPAASSQGERRSAPALPVGSRTPDQIVKAFFDELQADRVEAAYESLSGQAAMADRGDGARVLKEQTQVAIDEYGPVRGYELVGEAKAGEHLMRRTYLLLGEVLPLRWRFYFYRNSDGWNLVDLRVDDSLVDVFDDVTEPATR